MSTIEKAINRIKAGAGKKNRGGSSDENTGSRGASLPNSVIALPWQEMSERGILTPNGGRSQLAEELRAIKRPLLKMAFLGDNINVKRSNLIMVTSSIPGEGKSFTSINLAISIAMEMDRTALLVDTDATRSSIAEYLGYSTRFGLVDYLLDDKISLPDVLIKTDLPKLSILPAGKSHHYSTELLASENMNVLLDELATRYHDRVIIFDAPPILATSEAQVLATQMGQVVVVVEAVKTSQSMLTEALSKISQANISGLILNKSRIKKGGSSYDNDYYEQKSE